MEKTTTYEMCLTAFNDMTQEFKITELTEKVRYLAQNQEISDETVSRNLRNARNRNEIDYEIKNRHYIKIREWNNPAIKNQLSLDFDDSDNTLP